MRKQNSTFMSLSCLALSFLFFTFLTSSALVQEFAQELIHSSNPQTDLWQPVQQIPRDIPTPAPDHPGNVFMVGEEVVVRLPHQETVEAIRWQVFDDRRTVIRCGSIDQNSQNAELTIRIGNLDIGWYRIEFLEATGKVVDWTTIGVLARLAEPVQQDSPICVDSATAWFAPNNPLRQERFAQLAALVGVNWIRDRMSWAGAQTGPNKFPENTTYDSAAFIQARYGLKVLQVFHDTPGWTINRQLDGQRASRRFPRDLRVLFRFCKAMAQRYAGRVLAWEPWNEANITVFGGHTIDEMCTHQKAAYLGFKAGNPNVTVCWNVYAGAGTVLHTEGVLQNEVWLYFETFNIHSYRSPDDYLKQFAPAREAACGRPIWITECGIPLQLKTDRPWSELSPEDELRQAEFIAKSYASSLFAGVNRHFFFILGNFSERKNQFGLLRHDQTPRSGYVALAAVGRFLAGATCLGRWLPKDNTPVRIYAFRSRPDGTERDVLIAWAEKPAKWLLPDSLSVAAVYDYLGRPLGKEMPETMSSAAIFIILPKNSAQKLPLEPAAQSSVFRDGNPSPVVLQLQMPHTATNLDQQAHAVRIDKEMNLEIFTYNFSDIAVNGKIIVERFPNGWKLIPANWEVTLEPMERKCLSASLRVSAAGRDTNRGQWFKLRGNFNNAGRPTLAFRLIGKIQ